MGTLVAKTYSVVVVSGLYDVVADKPDDLFGDSPRLGEYASRVVSATMLDGHASRFAIQVASTITPTVVPAEEAVVVLSMSDVTDAGVLGQVAPTSK